MSTVYPKAGIKPASRKVCTRCHKKKALADFSPQRERSDGRHSWCRECLAAVSVDRYHGDGVVRSRTQRRALARRAALRRLREKHPEEFKALYAEELRNYDL